MNTLGYCTNKDVPMPKSSTPKSIQNRLQVSPKKTVKELKPSPHVLRYLMAYSSSFEILNCGRSGQFEVGSN